MKIAFFEIKDWERNYIKKRLKGHKLVFFKDPLNKDNLKSVKDFSIVSIFIYSKIKRGIFDKM